MQSNRAKALTARRLLCEALNTTPSVPDDMIGSLAAVMLPPARDEHRDRPTRYHDALQDVLIETYGIQVPIYPVPPRVDGANSGTGARVVRIAAQLYNSMEQYEYLARALRAELRLA